MPVEQVGKREDKDDDEKPAKKAKKKETEAAHTLARMHQLRSSHHVLAITSRLYSLYIARNIRICMNCGASSVGKATLCLNG